MRKNKVGWKVGVMTKDLCSYGASVANLPGEFKAGDKVFYKKMRVFDSSRKEWEYHYTNENGTDLVRSGEFLIKE